MDRPIEKKRWPPEKLIPIIVICAVILFLAYQVISRSGETRLKVDPSRMTISKVKYGEFLEYYPFDGSVEPVISVYLDVEEGGRVEEIYVEGGQPIQKGDPILRFSNDTLRRNSIDTESRLLDNLDTARNTQITVARNKIGLRETLLELEYRITKLERRHERLKKLKTDDSIISDEEFENLIDELKYMKDKRDLLRERIKQEDILSEKQMEQANMSIERLYMSLDLLTKTVESLDVKAPISGHLSSIDAEIGQTIGRGKRIGQIDVLDNFKIRTDIDQYYISKVSVGTKGKFSLNGEGYEAEVKKIYPEVVNNVFKVDMAFIGDLPEGIRRGQELTVELSFSEAGESLMITKGGFYQQTAGRWVYLISADGKSAYRADIRLGRQNPRYVEILEGLKEGDWVITSGYDSFKEADTLIFKEPLDLAQ